MTIFLLVFGLLPLLAVIAGFLAISRVAQLVLLIGGGYFLLASALVIAATWDCSFGDFRFRNCTVLPDIAAQGISGANLFNQVFGAPIAVLLLILAGGFEFRARKIKH